MRAGATLAALLCACAIQAQAAPSFEEVRAGWRSSETLVLDRSGQPLQRVRTDPIVRRGEWVPLAQVSPALLTALVYSEDRRFWEHSGVDWRAVPAAAWGNLWNRRTRGASTITMQLAGLLEDTGRSGGRSVGEKITQAAAATWLETRWRKDQILEAYLNLVPLRGEIVGVDALSRTLFGKAPHGLDADEGAIAAVLVRAPNAGATRVAQRACDVLRESQGLRDCSGIAVRTEAALAQREFAATEGIAPHFARMVLRSGASAPRITTTLRADLQRFAAETLRQHLRELRHRNVEDGSVIVLDNASGEVLAWVGSSGDLSDAQEVDGVTAVRQAGSTLKPFLYAQAIAERRLTAASLLDDSPASIPTAAGLYVPQNYDHHFKGWVSVRTALGASLNVPAVRAGVMVTPEAMARTLKAAGIPLRESGDYYGYSLALGSAEVPLLGLANAYRTLANGGRAGPVSWTARAGPAGAVQAIDPAAAFIVGDILSDPNARARTFGTGSILSTRMWTAVKTGTSKDMRDNWAVGWSSRYTVGVWVGNASGAPMHDVSGTSGAAPVWAALMRHLHAGVPSRGPAAPAGLVHASVRFANALEASREEWFIAGTEQKLIEAQDGRAARHITSPADGTIVALDPDIPPARQKLQFVAPGGASLRWRVDGREFARGAQAAWLPWPGRHVVQLTDGRGTVLDEVRIEVRGAGVLPAWRNWPKL